MYGKKIGNFRILTAGVKNFEVRERKEGERKRKEGEEREKD